MTEWIVKSTFFSRVLDATVPLLTWLTITLPLWLSPFHPAIVAYFIIAFDLYFFYKSVHTAYFAVVSYKRILEKDRFDFAKKITLTKGGAEIAHFIIIPNYKEPLHKLESTIESITQSDYPYKNLYLALAFEKREEEVTEKAVILLKKYRNKFRDILLTYHEIISEEIAGKASNQTFAAREIVKYIDTHRMDEKKVLVTTCDADSHLSKNYFSYLTYVYLKDRGGLYHFYWAPLLLYNNFWQLPLFVRIQATLSSIVRLAVLSYKENLIQVSTYSTNLWLLKKINFWDVNIIPEDWHVYLQAFFKFGEKVKTLPLYTLINGDAVYSGNLLKTLTNRYEQEKRWAWGVSDIGYSLRMFLKTPHISPFVKIKKILYLMETHLLWPTSFFILTISASIPPLINPVFKRTVLGFILPQLSGLILTFASLLLILYVYLDIKLRQKVNLKTKLNAVPLLFIQWYFLPLVSFLFSSLPALESHTRLLFGKKIKYKVTEKV